MRFGAKDNNFYEKRERGGLFLVLYHKINCSCRADIILIAPRLTSWGFLSSVRASLALRSGSSEVRDTVTYYYGINFIIVPFLPIKKYTSDTIL